LKDITDRQINDFFGEYERPVRFYDNTPYNHSNNFRRRIMHRKKDCFAYRKARCKVLTEMVCRYGPCSFYKTVQQDRCDREKYKFDKNYKQGDLI